MKATVLDMSAKCIIAEAFDTQDPDEAFAHVSGTFNFAAEYYPDALCLVADVQKIFDRLFNMRFGKVETPGAATPRESR